MSTVYKTGAALRAGCRAGEFRSSTAGQAPNYVQANLAILPKDFAEEFRAFCQANMAACPLLEVTEPGQYEARKLAKGSDLRTDLPKYRIWKDGKLVEERSDICDLWTDDMQAFLIGCSFSWEDLLEQAGLTPRHVEEGKNVPMYDSNIGLVPVGPFRGHMVVSMRPYLPQNIQAASEITGAFVSAHGPPVQVGEPEAIGVADPLKPDYGDAVEVRDGEVPCFWACGVTPANALRNAKLPLAITHAPGHMFLADITTQDLKTWQVPGTWSSRPAKSQC